MDQHDQTEQTLINGSILKAIEGPHRERLKRELLERASRKGEDRKMWNSRRTFAYVACVLLLVSVAGATGTYVFMHINTGRPAITMREPVQVAEQVFTALQTDNFSLVEDLFPSKNALASIWPGDSPFVTRYDELKAKLRREFDQCLIDYPGLADAELVRVDGDYGVLPPTPGSPEGAACFDNAHLFVRIGDLVYDIKLDELFQIDGVWYLVELPGKRGARPPKPIDAIR